jgi:hypothetical protein
VVQGTLDDTLNSVDVVQGTLDDVRVLEAVVWTVIHVLSTDALSIAENSWSVEVNNKIVKSIVYS